MYKIINNDENKLLICRLINDNKYIFEYINNEIIYYNIIINNKVLINYNRTSLYCKYNKPRYIYIYQLKYIYTNGMYSYTFSRWYNKVLIQQIGYNINYLFTHLYAINKYFKMYMKYDCSNKYVFNCNYKYFERTDIQTNNIIKYIII